MRPIPGNEVELRSHAESVYDAVAVMIDQVNRASRERLSVRQMVGICRAADAVDGGVRELLGSAGASRRFDWNLAGEHLAIFEDGMRPLPHDTLLEAADRASTAITSVRNAGAEVLSLEDREALRRSAEVLPALAAALEVELQVRARRLIVPVGKEPLREARAGEWLTRKPFIATREDLEHVVGLFGASRTHGPRPVVVERRSAGLQI
jgi:hypothetical protein